MQQPAYLSQMAIENEPLSQHTWFGLGGPARWFAEPSDTDELGALVRVCYEHDIPIRALGLGANLLVCDDGVDDMVVRLKASPFRHVQWPTNGARRGNEEVTISVGAGTDIFWLVNETGRHGLSGLECMGGIPGTLGGAIRMNAGGRHGQISNVVKNVTVVDTNGTVRTLPADEMDFAYRHTELNGAIVCGATLKLIREDPEKVRQRLMEIWTDKRQTQPFDEASAGCVFRNPPGHNAGQLIDRAGIIGKRIGGATVSKQHANFIIAQEGATARDVLRLIGIIRREVAERFGVELELEIEVWGYTGARTAELIA